MNMIEIPELQEYKKRKWKFENLKITFSFFGYPIALYDFIPFDGS